MAVSAGRTSKARPHTNRADDRESYELLVRTVAAEGAFSEEVAKSCIIAVIATLEARLSFTDVSGLEAELPAALRDILHREPILDLPGMDGRELFARVRMRLHVTLGEAESITRVVLRALRACISTTEAAIIDADLLALAEDTLARLTPSRSRSAQDELLVL